MLNHLDATYGIVTADDLVDNIARLEAQWSPIQPLENLWSQIIQAQLYAAAHDPISEQTAVRAAITNLTNSGVFTDALKDWRKRPAAQQTWVNVVIDFNLADTERLRVLTSAQAGYQQHANLAKQPDIDDNKENNTRAASITMAYCWSHGLGRNLKHTSKTCTAPEPGHCKEATVENMLGGMNLIRRKNGERQVFVAGEVVQLGRGNVEL